MRGLFLRPGPGTKPMLPVPESLLGPRAAVPLARAAPILLCEQSFAAAPVQHCADTLLQLGGLVLIVMRRAFDPHIFLVFCRKGRADRRIVGGGHGVVRQILDLQYGRAADAGGVLRPFRVRFDRSRRGGIRPGRWRWQRCGRCRWCGLAARSHSKARPEQTHPVSAMYVANFTRQAS